MLTGLLSRWGFSELLSKGFHSIYRDGILLLIDIDNFKLINDHRGHKTGDEALKRFGEILQGYFSDKKNLLCRWGGDEFIVLFFDSEEKLDRLMEGVSRDFLDYINKIEPLVDISIGSVHIKNCRTVDDLLALADQFMYKQKKAKRKI
jgi:diguanylate cyclase (GGDEF)-like protein